MTSHALPYDRLRSGVLRDSSHDNEIQRLGDILPRVLASYAAMQPALRGGEVQTKRPASRLHSFPKGTNEGASRDLH